LGHTDLASEMIKVLDQDNQVNFDNICSEVEKLFVDPDSVMALIDSLKGESSENKDKDLINYLAAQITDSQMASKDVLGLTSVLNLISNLQKPVIVHNGMLDLMFMHDKFFAPLPDDLLEYKTSTNKLFPHIYDTKHLMNTRM
jgi:hypothetical protein